MYARLKQIKLPMFCALPIVLAGFSPLLLTGCLSGKGLAKSLGQLKGDPAAFVIDVVGFWGTAHILRVNPLTNTMPYSVTRDGTISVNQRSTSAMP